MYVWESDDEVIGEGDPRIAVRGKSSRQQGTRRFTSTWKSIKELKDKEKVSIHQVSSQSDPYLPPKDNMIINAWCYSHGKGMQPIA
ncbi:hypothetical protein GUITHDRAFT_115970 [Guillardia theta CCMP2712]|uniref:Uncharacterized protein n=1 Tax=Guillardia theta (strain CCMP2712) TaxID=905079 RepID=L1IPU1_GUITC|nr:hypothetical protein GUITHDRAFT_115970 [Guillardia theta CCMP2712]EKX37830.1 hypothetical protein GUITHDRAFT_115970 [Guillardia theta CCMP2712]|eukprot:XP_005824810.1 hypothetical protein GUITHDRAFT_115970 [Guillardia theta CCMP2712]